MWTSVTRITIRAAAELAVTAGLVLAVFVFYLLVWTTTGRRRRRTTCATTSRPSRSRVGTGPRSPPPELGEGLGILHIPALGDWDWVVVEGVDDEDLSRGPGHFPDTALPGEVGNFAVAAHRRHPR